MSVKEVKEVMQVIRLHCEEDDLHLEPTGGFQMTQPVSYEYKCPKCGCLAYSHSKYPVLVPLSSAIDSY